ncbi:MAG: hypothetical protein P8X74_24240, partial [Reinekea sp.]
HYGLDNPVSYFDPDGNNAVTLVGGLMTETYHWATGNGFDSSMLAGALKDGYDGEGAGFAKSAADDALTFVPLGAVAGAAVKLAKTTSKADKLITVTSWADKGHVPDLKPGRWVIKGKASALNFLKTGLNGPKVDIMKKFPFVKFQRSKASFKNSITGSIPSSKLEVPKGFGPDGWIKALFGQRKIK